MASYVRFVELDVLRGWAITLMITFHICYDLNYFGYISIDIYQGTFWLSFRSIIVGIFLVCMGISLSLAHTPSIKWDKVKKRILLLFVVSLLVSGVTYLVFPLAWIYFGVLHFILSATVLGLFSLPYPRLSLFVSFLILFAYIMDYGNMHWLWVFVDKNILNLPPRTVDLVFFVPWFSFVLIGISMASYGYHKKLLQIGFFNPSLRHNNILSFLGKNALLIYLIHQPLVFGVLMLFDT